LSGIVATLPSLRHNGSAVCERCKWIAFCSFAAKQNSHNESGVLHHALNQASKIFQYKIRFSVRQLLSSIVVFGAVLGAHGKEGSVGTLLSHTRVISSQILDSPQSVMATITRLFDVISKERQRAQVSRSKLREISYTSEKGYGKL
jgi:hypothetical protein